MKRIVYHVSLILAFGLLSLSLSAAQSTPPKVVFVGDYITTQWTSAFAANPNWINQGYPAALWDGSENESINFAAIESLHPAAVHLLIGLATAVTTDDANTPSSVPGFLNYINEIVQEAEAANIKVILGLEPSLPNLNAQYLQQINSAIATYGAKYNIPVINYADALCNCVNALINPGIDYSVPPTATAFDIFNQYGGGGYIEAPLPTTFPNQPPPYPGNNDWIITPTGYNLMTQMAEATINTMNLKLITGWLSDVEQLNPNIPVDAPNPIQVNTVGTPAVVKFTPIGYYSDNSTHPMLNTTFQGSSGTWTSSNPLVMYVNQDGLAWALSQGTTRISYISPTGVVFSPWVMYVNAAGIPPCCT
jgi:hypothetical protein